MLVRQINEISMRSALIKAFFGGLGFRSAIENLVRSCFIYHIIDIATGTILLSLENAQQCTFSPDGQFLLVREARQAGKITAFVASLLNDTKSLDNTKKISDIQYTKMLNVTKIS